jgi:hypothetical protein
MKTIITSLFKRFDRKNIELEVEDELDFHFELLVQENLRQGMTLEKAENEALKRFGNIGRIKNQCVEISKRSHSFLQALKSFLIVVFLAGVLVRVSNADIYGKQIGNMLIVIAALSSLLLYIRGLRYLSFIPKGENSLPLGLSDNKQMPFAAYDRRGFTPVEHIIADD